MCSSINSFLIYFLIIIFYDTRVECFGSSWEMKCVWQIILPRLVFPKMKRENSIMIFSVIQLFFSYFKCQVFQFFNIPFHSLLSRTLCKSNSNLKTIHPWPKLDCLLIVFLKLFFDYWVRKSTNCKIKNLLYKNRM